MNRRSLMGIVAAVTGILTSRSSRAEEVHKDPTSYRTIMFSDPSGPLDPEEISCRQGEQEIPWVRVSAGHYRVGIPTKGRIVWEYVLAGRRIERSA